MDKINVFVVGRHAGQNVFAGAGPAGEDCVVAGQQAVTFPATREGCRKVIDELLAEADALGAVLLFQAIPGQLAAALFDWKAGTVRRFGVIISKPGERPAGVEKAFQFTDAAEAAIAANLAKTVNPNVKAAVEDNTVKITVDPPMKFEFDHIEWF